MWSSWSHWTDCFFPSTTSTSDSAPFTDATTSDTVFANASNSVSTSQSLSAANCFLEKPEKRWRFRKCEPFFADCQGEDKLEETDYERKESTTAEENRNADKETDREDQASLRPDGKRKEARKTDEKRGEEKKGQKDAVKDGEEQGGLEEADCPLPQRCTQAAAGKRREERKKAGGKDGNLPPPQKKKTNCLAPVVIENSSLVICHLPV